MKVGIDDLCIFMIMLYLLRFGDWSIAMSNSSCDSCCINCCSQALHGGGAEGTL